MPTAYLSPSQLKELTDVSVNPGSGENNYPLTWNNTNGRWQASNNIAGVTIRKGLGASTQAIGDTPSNSSGVSWIAQGTDAGASSTTGAFWIAQGAAAGSNITSASFWIAQGVNCAVNANTDHFLAQGRDAGFSATSSLEFMAQGFRAGRNNQSGNLWLAQGRDAGFSNTTGGGWLAQGVNAGLSNTTGAGWLAQGYQSGFSNATGSSWYAAGSEAGYFDTRSNSMNIANSRSKSLICGLFETNCIYFGNPGPITSTATVPVPTAAVHAAASNTARASLRIDAGVAPTTPNTGDIWVNTSNNSLDFQLPLINLQGTQVLATRRTGWTAPTGTATRTTFATFAGQDISATPTEAEVQAIDDHVKVLSERLKALIDDLTTHGLIGT